MTTVRGHYRFTVKERSDRSPWIAAEPALLAGHQVAVLGLVTTKHPAMEKKDDLRRRIDEATRFCPIEQLALSSAVRFRARHRRPGNDL